MSSTQLVLQFERSYLWFLLIILSHCNVKHIKCIWQPCIVSLMTVCHFWVLFLADVCCFDGFEATATLNDTNQHVFTLEDARFGLLYNFFSLPCAHLGYKQLFLYRWYRSFCRGPVPQVVSIISNSINILCTNLQGKEHVSVTQECRCSNILVSPEFANQFKRQSQHQRSFKVMTPPQRNCCPTIEGLHIVLVLPSDWFHDVFSVPSGRETADGERPAGTSVRQHEVQSCCHPGQVSCIHNKCLPPSSTVLSGL